MLKNSKWVNLTAQRAFNVDYTNDTGRTIEVAVTSANGSSGFTGWAGLKFLPAIVTTILLTQDMQFQFAYHQVRYIALVAAHWITGQNYDHMVYNSKEL